MKSLPGPFNRENTVPALRHAAPTQRSRPHDRHVSHLLLDRQPLLLHGPLSSRHGTNGLRYSHSVRITVAPKVLDGSSHSNYTTLLWSGQPSDFFCASPRASGSRDTRVSPLGQRWGGQRRRQREEEFRPLSFFLSAALFPFSSSATCVSRNQALRSSLLLSPAKRGPDFGPCAPCRLQFPAGLLPGRVSREEFTFFPSRKGARSDGADNDVSKHPESRVESIRYRTSLPGDGGRRRCSSTMATDSERAREKIIFAGYCNLSD